MNSDQQAAVAVHGEAFVSAGAGTGKTTVLVERFVRLVCDEGLDVGSILVITYTRKAAGELRARIRAGLAGRGRHDLARELDGAWISTIHGFCARLLRTHPFPVGIDPRFRELADEQGAVVRGESFERALTSFCASSEPERLRLLATYGAAGLRRMLIGVHETLRSAGRPLVLELGERRGLPELLDELREAAQCLVDDPGATPNHRAAASAALELPAAPERLLDLSALRASGPRAKTFDDARKAVEQAALEVLAARDRTSCRSCSPCSRPSTPSRRSARRRSTSRTCSCSRATFSATTPRSGARSSFASARSWSTSSRIRTRSSARSSTRSARTSRSRETGTRDDRSGSSSATSSSRSTASGTPTSRSSGTARAAAARRLTLVENYRSRPEVLAAVNHLFAPVFGDGFQPLAASKEFADPVFGHPVELLVTEKAAFAGSGEHWRRAEARLIASRVRELVDAGAAAPGEIVLLFAAGTDAEWYEEELRGRGLPTYRATGRGYFGQQQVVDLLMYLRLLHNRYDDEALASVLASPFVGVSNDALVLVRRHAGRRPLFSGLERSLPDALGEDDARLIRAFRQRYERLVAASGTCRSSVCARRRSPSTTTTLLSSRGGTASAGTRTSAS